MPAPLAVLNTKGETGDKAKYKFIMEKADEKEIILFDAFYSSADTYDVIRGA